MAEVSLEKVCNINPGSWRPGFDVLAKLVLIIFNNRINLYLTNKSGNFWHYAEFLKNVNKLPRSHLHGLECITNLKKTLVKLQKS